MLILKICSLLAKKNPKMSQNLTKSLVARPNKYVKSGLGQVQKLFQSVGEGMQMQVPKTFFKREGSFPPHRPVNNKNAKKNDYWWSYFRVREDLKWFLLIPISDYLPQFAIQLHITGKAIFLSCEIFISKSKDSTSAIHLAGAERWNVNIDKKNEALPGDN